MSLDGYGAGPHQDLTHPLGVGGTDLHQWLFPTRTIQQTLFGAEGGTTGVDDDLAETYSDRFEAPGPTWTGRAGGVTTRPTMFPPSS